MLRRRRDDRPALPPPPADPLGALDRALVPSRLLGLVDDAVAHERRWRAVTASRRPGPVADRLTQLGAQVVAGALDVYAVAVRVGELERVLEALDPEAATAAFKAGRRRASAGEEVPELEALEARFTSVQRLLNRLDEAEGQLGLLDARLGAAVARGAELALVDDGADVRGAGADLDAVVGELGALRRALDGLDA